MICGSDCFYIEKIMQVIDRQTYLICFIRQQLIPERNIYVNMLQFFAVILKLLFIKVVFICLCNITVSKPNIKGK